MTVVRSMIRMPPSGPGGQLAISVLMVTSIGEVVANVPTEQEDKTHFVEGRWRLLWRRRSSSVNLSIDVINWHDPDRN